MRKTSLFFLSLALLGAMLFTPLAGSPAARAAPVGVTLRIQTPPPARVCLGDQVPVVVSALYKYPGQVHVSGAASGGTLSPSSWILPRGIGFKMLSAVFTPTVPGEGTIAFSSAEGGGSAGPAHFEIEECQYDVEIYANEQRYADPVSYQVTVQGDGVLTASDNGEVAGSGNLLIMVDLRYHNTSTSVRCQTNAPVQGSGGFSVAGTRTDRVLVLDFIFPPLQMTGNTFDCEDANGRTSTLPMLPSSTVNPQDSLPLQGIKLSPWSVYPFNFGTKGKGYVVVTPRSGR